MPQKFFNALVIEKLFYRMRKIQEIFVKLLTFFRFFIYKSSDFHIHSFWYTPKLDNYYSWINDW